MKEKESIKSKSDSKDESIDETPKGASISMSIKAWTSDTPYMAIIKEGKSLEEKYERYIEQRKDYIQSPAFFLDVAHFFFDVERKSSFGLRVLTTLVDLKLENPRLIRIVANKLSQEFQHKQALRLFEKVALLLPEEPQSLREAALSHSANGNYQQCTDLLWKLVCKEWPIRFQHIEDEVLTELNRTIWLAKKNGVTLNTSAYETRFLQHLPMDIHCTITWDTDDLCIDLHIIEPSKENCYYGKPVTKIGGWSSPDYSGCTAYSTSMLREYMIKRAMKGTYNLKCNYYSNYRQDLTGGAIIWFTVYINYGTDKEEHMATTLRLGISSTSPTSSSSYDIGAVKYE